MNRRRSKNPFLFFLLVLFFTLGSGFSAAWAAASWGVENIALKYLIDREWPPYHIVTNKGLFGFEVDVNEMLLADTAYRIQYDVREDIQDIALLAKDKNWVFLGWRIEDQKLQGRVLMTEPLFEYRWGSFVHKDSSAKKALSSSEFKNLKFGVVGEHFPFSHLKRLGCKNIEVYDTSKEAMHAVMDRDVDVWFEDLFVGYYTMRQNRVYEEIEYRKELETVTPVAIYLTLGNEKLLELLNKRIQQIKDDGTYEILYKQYFGQNSPDHSRQQKLEKRKIQAVVISAIFLCLVGFFLITHYVRKLRKIKDELVLANKKQRDSWERYITMATTLGEGLFFFDPEKDSLFLSSHAREILEITELSEEINLLILGKALLLKLHAEDIPRWQEIRRMFCEHPPLRAQEVTLRMTDAQGETRKWIRFRAEPVNDGVHHVQIGGAFKDITDVKRLEREIDHHKTHDALIGLYNLAGLQAAAAALLVAHEKEGTPVYVFYFSLGGFYEINKNYGHREGDRYLKRLCSRIAETLPEGTLWGRVKPDCFVVFSPSLTTREEAAHFAQKLITIVGEVSYRVVRLDGNVGVSIFPDDGKTAESLIQLAESAAVRAKGRGKNQFVFCSDGEEGGS